MDTLEIALRLFAATAAGALFGLNRDMHDKQTGVRTLGLVGLGSALAVMAAARIGNEGDVSRAIQGIVTGIGFLGAGVIVRPATGSRIHGLTTAACTWLTACVGVACAVAEWRAVAIGLALAFVVLVLGGPFEKWVRRRWPSPPDDGSG
jgi:putative Mg2+ transporter-C (MgtC) family protein